MIPLALVTGFLGSGKTTYLKHLRQRYQGRKIVWLVNEFAARDVDASVLGDAGTDVVSIAGGSIFCRCLVTEFIGSLRDLPNRFGTSESPLEGVVIEASGMANPAIASTMLREARLDSTYQLANITAIVDPGTFLKLLHTLPNIRTQVEAASHVLLNKTDLHPAALIKETEAALREINPDLAISRTSYCQDQGDVFGGALPPQIDGDYALCRDPNFESFSVPASPHLDWKKLRAATTAAAGDIYRLKGYASQEGRPVHVDYSSSGWLIEECTADHPAELALIVRTPCSTAARQVLDIVTGSA